MSIDKLVSVMGHCKEKRGDEVVGPARGKDVTLVMGYTIV